MLRPDKGETFLKNFLFFFRYYLPTVVAVDDEGVVVFEEAVVDVVDVTNIMSIFLHKFSHKSNKPKLSLVNEIKTSIFPVRIFSAMKVLTRKRLSLI